MADQSELREGTREMLSPGNVNERLEDAVAERPQVRHMLDLGVLLRAVLIAAVLTLICALLFSPVLAAFVLVLSFFAAWFVLGKRSHERRRPTRPANDDDEDGEGSEDE
jgi:Flp pilus assembly protein TadB